MVDQRFDENEIVATELEVEVLSASEKEYQDDKEKRNSILEETRKLIGELFALRPEVFAKACSSQKDADHLGRILPNYMYFCQNVARSEFSKVPFEAEGIRFYPICQNATHILGVGTKDGQFYYCNVWDEHYFIDDATNFDETGMTYYHEDQEKELPYPPEDFEVDYEAITSSLMWHERMNLIQEGESVELSGPRMLTKKYRYMGSRGTRTYFFTVIEKANGERRKFIEVSGDTIFDVVAASIEDESIKGYLGA